MSFAITTARLRLRPATRDDVDALHRLWTHPDVRRYLWDDVVISRERAAAVVEDGIASFARDGFGLWTVHDAAGGTAIGFCGLRIAAGTDDVELVYGIAPERWGRGLASEAVRAVLAFAFTVAGLERVTGVTDAPNVASMRVMEKAGMVRESPADAALPRFVLRRPGPA